LKSRFPMEMITYPLQSIPEPRA